MVLFIHPPDPTRPNPTQPLRRCGLTSNASGNNFKNAGLCQNHLCIPAGVNNVPVLRSNAIYFGCERCTGLTGAHSGEEPPLIGLARLLDRALSELVVFHARIALPFVHSPPDSLTLPLKPAWDALKNDIPVSLAELQRQIRLLRYKDVAVLKEHVQKMFVFDFAVCQSQLLSAKGLTILTLGATCVFLKSNLQVGNFVYTLHAEASVTCPSCSDYSFDFFRKADAIFA